MSTYQIYLEKYAEFGVVEEVYHPVIWVGGLPGAMIGEIVMFENNSKGQILSVGQHKIEILLLDHMPVKVGMQVARTGKNLSIELGNYLMGQIINPLGKILTQVEGRIEPDCEREIDVPPPSIENRVMIDEPLLTGVSLVDLLLPLGKGQREMVVGDRKTGKSAFLLSVVKNHILGGGIVVWAAIGKRAMEIEQYREFISKEGLIKKIVMVTSTSLEAQSLIYLTPFTGMTIAEYFKDQGQEVLLILDDLSTHAKFYREISLLGRKFPGRDSYPSDIFYTHARLLERAGNYNVNKKSVSISCLAVAETIENDLTDYIVSNLISITDGHLLFDSAEFSQGHRPAVNPTLSVTRVGRQTQSSLHQDISQQVMEFIINYQKTQQLAHFGAELTAEVKIKLDRGQKLYAFFQQATNIIVPLQIQIIMMGMLWLDWFGNQTEHAVRVVRSRLIYHWQKDPKVTKMLDQLIQVVTFKALLEQITEAKQELLAVCDRKIS